MNAVSRKSLMWSVIFAVVVLFIQHIAVQRENNANINPLIFKAFDNIERRVDTKYDRLLNAGKDPEQHLSRRDLWVYNEARSRAAEAAYGPSDGSMSAQEYYWELLERGFTLPSLYEPGYDPKKPWWKA